MKIAHKDDSCYKIPTQVTWLCLQRNWINVRDEYAYGAGKNLRVPSQRH